jgi:hypothetical protein
VKTKSLLVLLGIGGALAAAFYLVKPSQPEYKGVTLHTWVERYAAPNPNPQKQEAKHAIQTIGTNAIPYLLKWIDYEEPTWPKKASRWIPYIYRIAPWWFSPKQFDAAFGFAILGTNAASAVPTLANILNDTNRITAHSRVAYALCCIGTPALPALAAALRNKEPNVAFFYDWVTNVDQPRSINMHPEQYMELFIIATNTMAHLAKNPNTNAAWAQGAP